MPPVSLKVLARELNLSVSAVSRALNDRSDIAQHTKDRVRALASKLNYEPNPYASSLRGTKTKTIGIIIPAVHNHFFSLAINGIEEVARENDFHVLISLTHEEPEQEASIIQVLAGGRVDGVLLSTARNSQASTHLNVLRDRGIPVVFFDRVYEDLPTATVTTDDYASGYQATRHLLEAGCRTVAHLTISDTLSIGKRRLQGYVAALQDWGLAYEEELVLQGHANEALNTPLIEALLRKRPEIDGIFASVEMLAMSSYEACRNLGLSIPEDVKVIGFSNLEIASLLNPPLTTITQPAYAIGREAARLLFRAIQENVHLLPADSVELKSELSSRRSTARL
ncbi:LacI family DNA-binding transcriptional regulator [Hymenobacter wooponensis]|uniref:LacI family transcriptional regulator n=1 Tax=Hymenobacter wooponensis TaxID=1525360 RepID=A0A4Z0MH13_9BACT|nr:LacI family DNA-binding transcriptional regulator [Hymenobacter wooponensis]TGD78796.1 LacI family transcriptional regulator [Hymenobacter wooponensis]